jgi:hypothetical protein
MRIQPLTVSRHTTTRVFRAVIPLLLAAWISLEGSVRMTAARQDSQRITIRRRGSQPSSPGPAEYFTGSVTRELDDRTS